MKPTKLICQNCGANLDIKENIAFCSYCGSKLALDDENENITYNYNYSKRDEAKIRDSERKELIRLKELENEEKQRDREHKMQKRIFLGWLIAGSIAFLLLIVMGFLDGSW